MNTFIVGLSIGTSQTTTALCVLEQTKRDPGYEYAVRHLERLPVGTPYPEQVDKTKELVTRLEQSKAQVSLIVDQTGVGRPVTDLFTAAKLKPKRATVTGGDTPSREGNEYRVPKRDLVSSAQVLLQAKRLTIASSLPLAQVLVSELLAFKATITLQRENTTAPPEPWRERVNDDLVLAVALAAWYGETYPPVQISGFDIPTGYQDNPWDV